MRFCAFLSLNNRVGIVNILESFATTCSLHSFVLPPILTINFMLLRLSFDGREWKSVFPGDVARGSRTGRELIPF